MRDLVTVQTKNEHDDREPTGRKPKVDDAFQC